MSSLHNGMFNLQSERKDLLSIEGINLVESNVNDPVEKRKVGD